MHPCLILYGATDQRSFPLVLMVGREPNESIPASTASGPYDFDGSPRCAFWNVSYGFAGHLSQPPLKTAELKRLCRATGASPLVYADALPISIKNAVRDKGSYRGLVPIDEIERHVRAVFSHEGIIDRVKLVLLSGLGPAFAPSVNAYRRECEARQIRCEAVPFFYPTNTPRIRDSLGEDATAELRRVMSHFVHEGTHDLVASESAARAITACSGKPMSVA